MKGLVKYASGEGNMELREVPEPQAGADQVKIEVKAAGICGSDLHIYRDDIAIPVRPPVIVGHEFSGVVTEVGEGVQKCKPGDRVTSETAYSFCGECTYCIHGCHNLCPEKRIIGYWYDGAFAKYTVVPAKRVRALPDSVDFVAGAFTEPLACVTHAALELTHITVGDVVLVSGPGSIGLAALQVALSQGARVIVSGTAADTQRLETAEQLGAARTVNISNENLATVVDDFTQGRGIDVVLECAGVAAATESGLKVIRRQGQFTQIGLFGRPVTLDFETICFKELRVTGSFGSRWDSWRTALDLLSSGKVKAKALVSHQIPLADWQRAFEMFEKKEGLKLVLIPE